MPNDLRWASAALCRDYFEEPEEVTVEVCRSCPVWIECLAEAVHSEWDDYLTFFLRGGRSAATRKARMRWASSPEEAIEALIQDEIPYREKERPVDLPIRQ